MRDLKEIIRDNDATVAKSRCRCAVPLPLTGSNRCAKCGKPKGK